MLLMPPVRQIISPNYTPVEIKHDLVILHMMEGGYLGSIAWLCNPAVKASAHLCLKKDGSEMTQLVPANNKAWAQCAFNSKGVSIEIEGFTAQGMADMTLEAAAAVAAWLCIAYAIPPVWAKGGQGRGVCCHNDLGAAGGGHHDICGVGDGTWQRMMTAIEAAYVDLKAMAALPDFALHGLPGPHQVTPTPDAPQEPSHFGASRAEASDVHDHPTPSLYPAHSVAAMQSDLNALMPAGATKLDVDGQFGQRLISKTSKALQAFQVTHSITADGLSGPESWRALDEAMQKAA
jgi:peptidoglycan hydrolase-like protein with peptidoglycan-binding domain